MLADEVDGDMWCYQKPGFEALLLAELQRQQQCSQFCDTLLKAGGVSVPAHSCILSAISPHISSALSSSPSPPSGQKRLLEFQALGACTLLHIVRLLYSGEMAGEGDTEKQEAIYAAANLGISGLVEVTKNRGRASGGGMKRYTEVGVQTEPIGMEEEEGRLVRWRREVRNGFTSLWKETVSDGGRDIWTQTEEQLASPCAPAHPALPYETIDMSALQSLAQTDSHDFVPVTLICPPSPGLQCSSGSSVFLQGSTTSASASVAIVTPQYVPVPPPLTQFSTQTASCVADSQSCWADPNPKDYERLEQFEGDIAGFIDYFLNPENKEYASSGRAGRKKRGARAARTGQQEAWRPRGRSGGRGRGGFTQRVDGQEIGVGKRQKVFLHRWGMSVPRTGQGGGAVGRKLYQKSREQLKSPRKRYRRKVTDGFEVGQSLEIQQGSDGGVASTQRGQRKTTPQSAVASLSVGRNPNSRNQPISDYISVSSKSIISVPTLSSSCPALHPTPSPAVQHVSPALSRLPGPRSPPPAPPPQEDHPEQMDCLLEQVMMGLHILPNNKATASQSPLPATSNSFGSFAMQNQQQTQTSSSEVPMLQQPCEGQLDDMLENFLQSFEQLVDSSNTRKVNETDEERCSEASESQTVLRKPRRVKVHGEVSHSRTPRVQRDDEELSDDRQQSQEAVPHPAVSSENSQEIKEKTATLKRKRQRRNKKTYLLSFEMKKTRKTQNPKARSAQDLKEQQQPVVKQQRKRLLSVRATLQGPSCASPAVTSPAEAQSSSEKSSCRRCCRKNCVTKVYPIRSRFRDPQFKLNLSDQLQDCRHGTPEENGTLLSSSDVERTTTPVQTVASCCPGVQREKNPSGPEEDLMLRSEEVRGSTKRGLKRGARSTNDTGDEVLVDKRICFDQTSPRETSTLSSESADLPSAAAATSDHEDVIDVETVSLSSFTDCLQETKLTPVIEAEEGLSDEDTDGSDEIIDVEGDQEDSAETIWVREDDFPRERLSVLPSHLDRGSAPDPKISSWTESSDEHQEVDPGENMYGKRCDPLADSSYATSTSLLILSSGSV